MNDFRETLVKGVWADIFEKESTGSSFGEDVGELIAGEKGKKVGQFLEVGYSLMTFKLNSVESVSLMSKGKLALKIELAEDITKIKRAEDLTSIINNIKGNYDFFRNLLPK